MYMHILTVLPWRSVSAHRSIMLSDLVKGPCWAINGFILDTNQVQKTEGTHLLAHDAGLCLTGNSSGVQAKERLLRLIDNKVSDDEGQNEECRRDSCARQPIIKDKNKKSVTSGTAAQAPGGHTHQVQNPTSSRSPENSL